LIGSNLVGLIYRNGWEGTENRSEAIDKIERIRSGCSEFQIYAPFSKTTDKTNSINSERLKASKSTPKSTT
jgi:hypothetical protein